MNNIKNIKESLKTVFLIFLVICNLILGCKIWLQKKLWPDGYNFFYNIKNFPIMNIISGRNSSLYNKSHIALPDKIIINTGYQTTRFFLNASHEQFENANNIAYEALSLAFSADVKDISEITEEEWYQTLTSRSIYLSYDINYSSDIMTGFFGVYNSRIREFADIISDAAIASDDMGNSFVIFKSEDKYYKVSIPDFDSAELDKLILYFQDKFDENDTASSTIINYSFDLRFNVASETQRVIIAPMVPIFNNSVKYNAVSSKNPITDEDDPHNSKVIRDLLSIFKINPNTMRRYTEADGTVVFVENDIIFKISPEGYLTYTSKNPQKGVLHTEDNSLYNTVCKVAEFMDKINEASNSDTGLYISSDLTDMNLSKITFDYIVNGIPVTINNENINHAVEVFTENGYITEYRQILRNYENTPAIINMPSYISAVDSVSEKNETDKYTLVEKMYVSYFDDLSIGEKRADWRLITSELERS